MSRPSNGTRFRVFERDAFTCRYCGRSAPAVMLEVDHAVSKANGGTDHFDNLVTSCFECNRGKRARSIVEVPPLIPFMRIRGYVLCADCGGWFEPSRWDDLDVAEIGWLCARCGEEALSTMRREGQYA